jgi:serine/threonine protein kinase/Tfp pilus assembly protein PilF
MGQGVVDPREATLDAFIEAYEDAHVRSGEAALADFLPKPNHPIYLAVLRELVRVDMEYSWQRGRPCSLDSYLQTFPQLGEDSAGLADVAYEEFRLRQQAGQGVLRSEYQERYGIDTSRWPLNPMPERGTASDLLKMREALPADDLTGAAQSFQAYVARHGPADLHAWQATFPGEPAHAQFLRAVHRANPAAAERLAVAMPEAGSAFLGFQLVDLLGKGAFGRVYLARQGDLAGRLVALKVSTDLWHESQTLARLQHTHIVPIYSVHRSSPFQAVCMPYLGRTTLADVIRDLAATGVLPRSGKALSSTVANRGRITATSQGPAPEGQAPQAAEPGSSELLGLEKLTALLEKRSYVDTVAWVGACLADGLGHAHERGIWHRDLKPANVLLSDEGLPMLLDFNLSEDRALRGHAPAAFVGGTLPYMAPEHLAAFEHDAAARPNHADALDGRSDVYALGVMLFELLTGRLPFATQRGAMPEVLKRMQADRAGPPPAVRVWNRDVSPALEAIVRHCLEPNPGRRYASARELEADLKSQLENRPLQHIREPSLRERGRKWLRRHPRLAAGLAIGACAAVLLAGLGTLYGVREYQASRLEAANAVLESAASLQQFRGDMRDAQVRLASSAGNPAQRDRALADSSSTLGRYQVMENPAWDKAPAVVRLSRRDQETLRENVAELLLLTAAVHGAVNDLQLALDLNRKAEACFPADRVPSIVWSQRSHLLGKSPEALALAVRAKETPVDTARDRAFSASGYILQGKFHDALQLLKDAARQEPDRFTVWLDQGLCHEALEQSADAKACYSTAIALAPRLAWLYLKRGMACLRLRQFKEARADFDRALELDPNLMEAYLQRAIALANLTPPDNDAALRDLEQAQARGAPRGRVLLMQAKVNERLGKRAAAYALRLEGLKDTPRDEAGWLARGIVHLHVKPEVALNDFAQALRLNPHSLAGLQNTAHVLAEGLGKPDEAIAVLDQVVRDHPDYAPAWAGRGVLLARQGKRAAAQRDAKEAILRDPRPATYYQVACVYALTSRNEPEDRDQALHWLRRALRDGYGLELIDGDRDLDPLRDVPEFRQVVDGARKLLQSGKK